MIAVNRSNPAQAKSVEHKEDAVKTKATLAKRNLTLASNIPEVASITTKTISALTSYLRPTKNLQLAATLNDKKENILKAKKILKTTRELFKDSTSKSSNKTSNKLKTTNLPETYFVKMCTLSTIRSYSTEKSLMLAMEFKLGNCGEMAQIAFALCQQQGMLAEVISYEDPVNQRFDHSACLVSIDDEDFIIDPWANTFCKLDQHIEALVYKAKQWEGKDKFVLISGGYTSNEVSSFHKDSNSLKLKTATESDIRNLKISQRSKPRELIDFSRSDYFRKLTTTHDTPDDISW